jgi:ABC-type multidrug transport system ATPase subunit
LKRQIGVVPEGMALLGRLTATESLHFMGRHVRLGCGDDQSAAIISQWRIVTTGSLEELRTGLANTLPGSEQQQRLTLEEIFLPIVGADGHLESTQELSWLA